MKFRVLIILLLLTSACNFIWVEVSEKQDPGFAVLSFFSPDSNLEVSIAPVVNAFNSSENEVEISELIVKNLKTNEVFSLVKVDPLKSVYCNTELKPKLGDVLMLECHTDKQENLIVAIDSVPDRYVEFEVLELGVLVDEDGGGSSATIEHKGVVILKASSLVQGHFYELEVFTWISENEYNVPKTKKHLKTSTSVIVAEDYYPTKTMMQAYYPQSLIFKCANVTGDLVVDFSYFAGLLIGQDGGTYVPSHHLEIRVNEVSALYYQYKSSLYKQQLFIKGDVIYGGGSTVVVPSNIENGAGIFAAYTSSVYQTIIEPFFYDGE